MNIVVLSFLDKLFEAVPRLDRSIPHCRVHVCCARLQQAFIFASYFPLIERIMALQMQATEIIDFLFHS